MKESIYKYCILILDFGSQYTQLLARRIRELGVYCEIVSWNITEIQIRQFNPNGMILSGGPESVTKLYSPRAHNYIFQAGIPVLGICYGMQTMALQLGGKVQKSLQREFGYTTVKVFNKSLLLNNINNKNEFLLNVWMSHNDKITILPFDFITIASTEHCPFAIIENKKKQLYGVQFHPEVTHTKHGQTILKNFIFDICQCNSLWTPVNMINDIIINIRQQVNTDKVILGLSGGVDSSVTAILLHRAIGKQLICIFIDNGLLRLNEAYQVMTMLNNYCNLQIIHISAEDRFLNALKGISEPETKRKIIGQVFIEIFNEQAQKISQIKWLAQGTIYSDIIESSVSMTGKSNIIKSHHNVGGLPKIMHMKLLEPLKKLFKDEVRNIGLELGLSYDIIYRHPFPGPGLGVRILGEIKKEYCDLLRRVDSIFIEELHKYNLYIKVNQAFAIFIPIKSVGIIGDNRTYNWIISLRAIESLDFMTAQWAHLPYDFLGQVSNRIINEIDGISRVLYDISGKPPATIEWE